MKRATYDMFFFNMNFSKDVKSADVVDKICATQGGCYFSDKNALDDPKYLDISERTKEIADEFFKRREWSQFEKPDTSYLDLPVREASLSESFSMMLNGFMALEKTQAAKEKILENKKRFMQTSATKKTSMPLAAVLKSQKAR